MIRSKALLGLAVLLATCFISSPATADVLNGTIFLGNAALAGFPTPFATAVINRTDTTHATITYTGLTQTSGGNTYQYYFGGDDAIGFNINATNYSIAFAFGGTCSPFPPPEGVSMRSWSGS